MKRIDELTRDELAALTDEQTETLIELEIAHAGIKPVLPPEYEEVPVITIQPTDMVYEVHGLNVRSKEDAETLAKIETCSDTYDYGAGYDYKYLNPPEPGTITVKKFYLHSDIEAMTKLLRLKKAVEERNAARRKEYTAYEGETKSITDHVNTFRYEAREFAGKVEYAKKIFEKHLKLAEGNHGIAVNFFKTAYKGQDEIVAKVLEACEEPKA